MPHRTDLVVVAIADVLYLDQAAEHGEAESEPAEGIPQETLVSVQSNFSRTSRGQAVNEIRWHPVSVAQVAFARRIPHVLGQRLCWNTR